MKTLYLTGLILFLFSLTACKKHNDIQNPQISQGTNFNLLLKTATKVNTTGGQLVNEYNYNSAGRLSSIKTTENYTADTQENVETFYRNSAGRLDSIVFSGKTKGVVSFTAKTVFIYDLTGRIILSTYNSTPFKDSSLYSYAGSVLQTRDDYRSLDGGLTYNLLRRAANEFDASGNLTKSVFKWTTPVSTDTLSFQYDNKINPVPHLTGFFYWAPFFYDDYKPINNLTQTIAKNVDSYSFFDYNYTLNNKPLYRKEKVTGGSNFTETYYYYD
jgi:hypothetical protein